MADVFISYKSERRRLVSHLARILQLHGYSVWYDKDRRSGLVGGDRYPEEIAAQLRKARVVIVLICWGSVESDWVLREVELAETKLLLVRIENIEESALPPLLQGRELIDLYGWSGRPGSSVLNALILQLARRAGRDPKPKQQEILEYEAQWEDLGALPLTELMKPDTRQSNSTGVRASRDEIGTRVAHYQLVGQAGRFAITPGNLVRLGRDPTQCAIVITESRVSGVHASLQINGSELLVRDENSNNGTAVAGQRATPGVWARVNDGDILRFGPIELRAQRVAARTLLRGTSSLPPLTPPPGSSWLPGGTHPGVVIDRVLGALRRKRPRIGALLALGVCALAVGGWLVGDFAAEDPESVARDQPEPLTPIVLPPLPNCESCVAGSSCLVSLDNTEKVRCRSAASCCQVGQTYCEPCSSGIGCIPSNPVELTPDERWSLRLAAIYRKGAASDPCAADQRDLWFCARVGSEPRVCQSQRDACRAGINPKAPQSRTGLPLSTRDLTRPPGLSIEIRDASPTGPVLARRQGAYFNATLQRIGLCHGFSMSFDTGGVDRFTFYLQPAPSSSSP